MYQISTLEDEPAIHMLVSWLGLVDVVMGQKFTIMAFLQLSTANLESEWLEAAISPGGPDV